MRILLVDDEPMMREVVGYTLRQHGFDVLEAGDGEEAFALLRVHTIDAIVSDVQMPRMDGARLLGLVREGRPDLPVFLMTGGAALTVQQALALGAVWLFSKTDLDGLVPALRRVAA